MNTEIFYQTYNFKSKVQQQIDFIQHNHNSVCKLDLKSSFNTWHNIKKNGIFVGLRYNKKIINLKIDNYDNNQYDAHYKFDSIDEVLNFYKTIIEYEISEDQWQSAISHISNSKKALRKAVRLSNIHKKNHPYIDTIKDSEKSKIDAMIPFLEKYNPIYKSSNINEVKSIYLKGLEKNIEDTVAIIFNGKTSNSEGFDVYIPSKYDPKDHVNTVTADYKGIRLEVKTASVIESDEGTRTLAITNTSNKTCGPMFVVVYNPFKSPSKQCEFSNLDFLVLSPEEVSKYTTASSNSIKKTYSKKTNTYTDIEPNKFTNVKSAKRAILKIINLAN